MVYSVAASEAGSVVVLYCYFSLRGALGWRGRCTGGLVTSGGVGWPHLCVMGVWREQPRDVILRGDTPLSVGGGGPWGTVALLGAGVNPPEPSSDY